MDAQLLQEITTVTEKFSASEKKSFQTTKDFYEFLKAQGVSASLEEVKNVLIDLSKQKPKQELSMENFDEVVGGAQVVVKNIISNNSKPVNVGKTVVLNI